MRLRDSLSTATVASGPPGRPARGAGMSAGVSGNTGVNESTSVSWDMDTTGGVLDVIVLAGGTGRRLGGACKPDVLVAGRRMLDHVLDGVAGLRGRGLPAGRVVVVAPQQVALPDGVLRALEDPPLGGPVAGVAAGLGALGLLGPRTGSGGRTRYVAGADSTAASGAGAPGVPPEGPTVPGAPAPDPSGTSSPKDPTGASTPRTGTGVGTGTGPAVPGPAVALLTCDAPGSWRALPGLLDALARAGAGTDGVCVRTAGAGGYVQHLLGVYRPAPLAAGVAPGGVPLRDVSVRRAMAVLSLRTLTPADTWILRDLDTWEDVARWDQEQAAGPGASLPAPPAAPEARTEEPR